jgi:glycosyltransferase involved in cell wall biosynthesis
VRVLYFHRDDGVHDRRFLDALGDLPVEVIALQLENRVMLSPEWKPAMNIRKISWSGVSDDFNWLQKTRMIGELKRICQEYKPDVIHAGPVDLCACLVASAGIRPLVSMSWGYDLLFNAENSSLSQRRVRYALERTAILLDDCQAVSQKAGQYGFPSKRIVTFPWGVDHQLYRPRETKNSGSIPAKRERVVLLSTRHMEKQYGCDINKKAFLKAALMVENLHLIMLGEGSLKNDLMRQISKAGLDSNVKFIGCVPENEMVTYFQTSDVYISASHSDGSSVSLLQAMACGLSSIVSDIPGNREWVTAGKNGWLFKDGDSDQLASLMIEGASKPELRTSLGAAARMIATERADWRQSYPKLLDAYHMAIDFQAGKGINAC